MKVPVYERQLSPEISQFGTGWNKPPVAAFGTLEAKALGALGNAVGDAAGEMAVIAVKKRQQADDAAVLEAYGKWSGRVNSFLHNPDKGLYARTLKEAKGATADAEKYFAEAERETFRELENNEQRNLFRKFVARNVAERMNGVSRFELREFERYRKNVVEEVSSNALTTISANFSDDGIFDAELDNAENAILTLYGDLGEEAVTDKVKELHSAAHEMRVVRWMEEDPRQAEKYFREQEKKILPARREELRTKTRKAMDEIILQETADAITAKYRTEPFALEHVRETYSGKMEKSLVTTLRTRYAEKRAAAAERRRTAAASLDRVFKEAPDARTLETEMRKRGLPEERIGVMTRQYLVENGIDGEEGIVSPPWEKAERNLRTNLSAYGAAPETADRILALHRGIIEDRIRGKNDDMDKKRNSLNAELAALGVTETERIAAVMAYGADDEPDRAKRTAELRAAAESDVWEEIQKGDYDSPDGGVEGRLFLRERLGTLGLGREASERLLKEQASRFTADRDAEYELVRNVITKASEEIGDFIRKGIFRNAALSLAERLGKKATLWQKTNDILSLRDELTGDHADLYLPPQPLSGNSASGSWDGWNWDDDEEDYVRPTGDVDENGRPAMEKQNN